MQILLWNKKNKTKIVHVQKNMFYNFIFKIFYAFSYTATNVESNISGISSIKLVLVVSKNKNILKIF